MYLTIGGRGEPCGQLYEAKVSALYSVVYGIKLALAHRGKDFLIHPLEAFWTGPVAEGSGGLCCPRPWKLGIPAPPHLAVHDVAEAIAVLAAKGKDPLVKDVVLEALDEQMVERFAVGDTASVATSHS